MTLGVILEVKKSKKFPEKSFTMRFLGARIRTITKMNIFFGTPYYKQIPAFLSVRTSVVILEVKLSKKLFPEKSFTMRFLGARITKINIFLGTPLYQQICTLSEDNGIYVTHYYVIVYGHT